jgi:hypothetical protein
MLSRIADLLLLPWSILTKAVLQVSATARSGAGVLLPAAVAIAAVLLINKALGARAAATPRAG